MRKGLTTFLVILLAVGAMLVSCKAEVGTPADELVAVSFEEGTSRAITATLEGFNKDNYYWKYAAKKADDSGLTSGQTEHYDDAEREKYAVAVSDGNPGLRYKETPTSTTYKPYKVPGFSQGLWNFTLYAYRDSEYTDLIYTGEAKNVSLSRGGENMVSVTVNPIMGGNGYIKIGEITFIPKKTGDTADQLKFIEVTNPDGSAVPGISYADDRYTVPAGIYKVTVKFANASQTIVYGEGYVIATVYAGLETVIGGNLSEMVTYAQFDADLNPDAVSVQAESEEIQFGTGDDVEIKTASTAEKEVKTSVARSDANAIIEAMAEEQGIDTGSSTKLKLTLNVDPTDATETTITYEIGMKATLTYTKDTQTQTSEKAVTALEKYVVVEIEMNSGLSDVTVKHSGTPMYPCETKGALDDATTEVTGYSGFFYYDPAGTLYIKTKNFSPFAISYVAPKNYVADVDGVKYGTLAEAVAKVKTDGTSKVTLLADIALEKTETVKTTKSFTLDLAGYDITAADCRAIHVQEGTLTLTGKGTIAAGTAVSTFGDSSSVIRVGDNAGTYAGLVIGVDVTISSSYCYGVTIFGNETNETYGQSLEVNGKIKVTGTASAISGNGSSGLADTTITINEGAEVYAENDYAIYHPQSGILTISGGKISGKGGIEAKAGTVNVNGGVITATAPEKTHGPYSNGPSTSGYALVAVSNDDYQGPAIINVNRCTIIGPVGKEYDDEDPGATVNVHARIGYEYYPSFAAAYEAAGPDDTVTSLEDLNISARINLLKTITVAGDNPNDRALFKVNTGDNRVFSIDDTTEKVVVTLENVYADGSESKIDPSGYARGVSLYNNKNVTLNLINTAVSSPYYAINVAGANKKAEVNISDSSVSSGWAALNMWSKTIVSVKDSVLSGVNNKAFNSEGCNDFSTIVINKISGGAAEDIGDSVLSFENVTIIGESSSYDEVKKTGGNLQALLDLRAAGVTCSFTNCSFYLSGSARTGHWVEGEQIMFWLNDNSKLTFDNCRFFVDGAEIQVSKIDDLCDYLGAWTDTALETSTIVFK